MKKGILTRGLAMGMVCSMAFLCACGKKNDTPLVGDTATETVTDKDHVYRTTDIEMPLSGEYGVSNCCGNADSIYALINEYSDDADASGTRLYEISKETSQATEIPLVKDENGYSYYDCITCDDEGNLYLVKQSYTDEETNEIYEDSEEIADEEVPESDTVEDDEAGEGDAAEDEIEGVAEKKIMAEASSEEEDSEEDGMDTDSEEAASEDEYESYEDSNAVTTIVKMDLSGKVLWEVSPTAEDNKSNSYFQSLAYVKGKGVLSCCSGSFSLYDEKTGEGKFVLSRKTDDDDYYYANLYRVRSGDVYLTEDRWDHDGHGVLTKFDPEKFDFTEDVTLPDEAYGGGNLYPGTEYDFYTDYDSSICAFNMGDEKLTKICDYTASDMLVDYVNFISDYKDGRLFVTNSPDNGNNRLSYFTKVDPSEIVDKETITIGTVYISENVRKQVVNFNRSNEKYRIKIVDYADDNTEDTGDGYMDSINKMGLELAQGQGPDIIVIDNAMPVGSYIEKGVLEPLDEYFEKDSEINVEDFLPNVMDMNRSGGKIYSFIPSFTACTCVAAKDNVGDDTVTIENYKDICNKNGIDPKLGMGYMMKDSAMEYFTTSGSVFVDYENGTCDYKSEGFVKLLEFINDLPQNMDEAGMEYEDFETAYRENKALLYDYFISSFEDYQVLKKGYFGKDIVFNGYPTIDGGKSFLSSSMRLAMNSASSHKDAVWEFMRSFMTDDFQTKLQWGFPVRESAMEALAKKAQEKPYYIDEKGQKVETSSFWGIGGIDVEITELSKEEVDQVMDFIRSISDTRDYEDNVVTIIQEEAEAYFEGQKSAEEVADIIQSRVSIYLSENM